MLRKSLALLPLLALPVSAVAFDRGFDERTYFSPAILFASPAEGTGFDDGWGVSLAIGKPFTERMAWELSLFGYDQSAVLPGSMRRTGFSFSALYFFADEEEIRPYIIAGTGSLRSRFQGVNDSANQVHAGLGFMFPASERMSFRLEGRYQKVADSGPHNDWQVLAGLSIPFFGQRSQPIPPTPPPVVREQAPAPQPAPRPAPAPPPPSFEPVYFALDSSTLDERSRGILDGAIQNMRDHPSLILELGGYTCTLGSTEYNIRLSERRARAVADYMVARGVERNRLVIRGYGEARPIADNSVESGRRMNRRTELVILER